MDLNSEEFNKKYKIGTEFYYYPILGKDDKVKVKTKSRAWNIPLEGFRKDEMVVFGSETKEIRDSLVKVEGLTGGISIKHLEEINDG